MMKKLLFFSLITTSLFAAEDCSLYFNGRLPSTDGRYKSFYECLRLMTERKVKTIVETGTARCGDKNFDGDGGSTILFAHWAQNHQAHFYSVDISEINVEIASEAVTAYKDNVSFAVSDSVQFLQNFTGTIDFLYLDSWDYDVNDPDPAQIHCLREIKAAYDKLTPHSIVMIDDCSVPGGGKGKLAIAWLLDQGWYKHVDKHQVLLLKK